MTIHFFVFSDARGGSSRQRAFRVVDQLRNRGLDAVIHEPPVLVLSRTPWPRKGKLILQTIHALFSIQNEDIIFLQRAIANKYFFIIIVAYLKLFRRKMIFDFDDPVYVHTPFKTRILTQMADAVIVCSHAQAAWATQFNPNVHIMHIALDISAYERFTKDYAIPADLCTIGWVGTGPEHLRNLKILAGVLSRLAHKTVVPFRFVLIGALKDERVYELFKNIEGLKVDFIDALDWNDPESVPCEIQKFDIGVLPHRNDGEWNRGKSSFKMLEYMACGVATIVSDFGEMPYVIQDGVNGYLARDEDEWVLKLENLLSDAHLRASMGRAGQQRVREEYCYDAIIPRMVELIKSLSKRTIG